MVIIIASPRGVMGMKYIASGQVLRTNLSEAFGKTPAHSKHSGRFGYALATLITLVAVISHIQNVSST